MAIGTPTVPVAAVASTANAASYATASWTPVADRLYLAAVMNSDASDAELPTLAGNGLTWVQVDTIQEIALTSRITLFRAMGASPSAGATTATFGTAQTGCAIHISEWPGIDTGGTDGSAAIVQSSTIESSGATDPLVTLVAFGSVDNATYGAFLVGNATLTVGSGFTQITANSYSTPTRNFLTEYLLGNDTSVDAVAGTGTSLGIAVEIKAAATIGALIEAALTGSGALAVALQGGIFLESALEGTGTLAVSVQPGASLAAALDATGTVGAALLRGDLLSAALSGNGTLVSDLTTAAGAPLLEAMLTGSGALSVALQGGVTLDAALGGSGTVAGALTTGVTLDAALAGAGSVAAQLTPGGALFAAELAGSALMVVGLFEPDPTPRWSVLVRWDGVNWDDIGPDVRQINWSRGSAGDISSSQPGSFSIRLQNSADRYLPTNPASPLFGLLRAGADVLIRCLYQGSYKRIAAGFVRTVKPVGSWIPSERETEIVGDDALGAWNRRDITLPAMRSGISIRDARAAVLDGLGLVGNRVLDAGESAMIEYGELVVIRDDNGEELATFEAGLTGTPIDLLDQINAAGLGRHFIRPGTTEAVAWQYISLGRQNKLDAAADASMTYGTDYDALDGWTVSDETRLSRVTVTPRQRTADPVQAVAGVAGGSEAAIESDLMPSLAHAQGVADHLQWRFDEERQRPKMLLQRRLPLMFERDLFDVIEVTDERYYITNRRMEIVGISGTWSGVLPQVTWTLQDAPQQPPLPALFTLGRDALGGPAVLGR